MSDASDADRLVECVKAIQGMFVGIDALNCISAAAKVEYLVAQGCADWRAVSEEEWDRASRGSEKILIDKLKRWEPAYWPWAAGKTEEFPTALFEELCAILKNT